MVGRKLQIAQFEEYKSSKKSEFIAVLGRRRIGKTYLIDETLKDLMCFQLTGIQTEDTEAQLQNFNRKLFLHSKAIYPSPPPNNWGEAFFQLRAYLDTLPKKQKQVIFLDELPWIYTPKSGFLQQLAHFWNDYISKHNHFILVICGSASSWIANHITNDKGGLHNRLTATIYLQPFTLAETKEFLATKNIYLTHQEIAKIYMAFGGIPYYLEDIKRGETATKAIERMCFEDNGRLKNEYDNLYKALFINSVDHEKIVEALAGSQKGMLRSQIIEKSKIQDGGPFTRAMFDLLSCGFVSTLSQFGQIKREEVYRLTDEYTAFYHRFIKSAKKYEIGAWTQLASSQFYKIWLGYAFELLVFRHIDKVKNKLGIAGIYSEVSTLYYKIGTANALQIDLLIDRKDNAINYCEIKHYDTSFIFDKDFYNETKLKMEAFQAICGKRKQVFYTLITNQTAKENEYSLELIDRQILLDDLF
jgi:uncharacterized protein